MRYEIRQLILSSIILFANGYGMIRSYNDGVGWGLTIIFAVLFGLSIMLCVIDMLILIG